MASKDCIFDASITENEKPDFNVLEAVENVGESERVLPTVEEERENNMYNETLSLHSRGECVSQLQQLCGGKSQESVRNAGNGYH